MLQLLPVVTMTPPKPPFTFNTSTNAAKHNTTILAQHNYNVEKAIRAQTFTTLIPGSEFRPVELLCPLLQRQPLSKLLHSLLTKGAAIHFHSEPDKAQRQTESKELIEYGNHKKARDNPAILRKTLPKKSFMATPLSSNFPPSLQISDAMIVPLGIAKQTTLTSQGTQIPKQ
jgi:hypothetical protein